MASKKRQIFIVGGKGKNVPSWLRSAFDYEQFDQENAKTRTIEPTKTPDAVVVLKSWIGHEHFYGARDLAERLGVPMILSPGGWSSSLKAAADLGVEWFIQDIERAKDHSPELTPQSDALGEFIDNAWREAYEREYEARRSLEKRYSKDRTKLEHAQQELERLKTKGAAAERVIGEIRAAASQQRKTSAEIQDRSERVAEALAQHIESLKTLFSAADDSRAATLTASSKMSDVRRLAQQNLDSLRGALTIAEDGLAMVRQLPKERPSPVSASNAGTDL